MNHTKILGTPLGVLRKIEPIPNHSFKVEIIQKRNWMTILELIIIIIYSIIVTSFERFRRSLVQVRVQR